MDGGGGENFSYSYFCNLEKRRQVRNAVDSLLINQNECSDDNIIAREVLQFYSNLYTSAHSSDDSEHFFKNVKNYIPTVENCLKKFVNPI